MRFIDPMPYNCTGCNTQNALRVRDLLALTAICPNCGAPFQEKGLQMRRFSDEVAAFFVAVQLILCMEEQLKIQITDETVESIRPWEDLTLQDLVVAAEQSTSSDVAASMNGALLSAVRQEYPKAPEILDFTAPLLDAVCPRRHYEGY